MANSNRPSRASGNPESCGLINPIIGKRPLDSRWHGKDGREGGIDGRPVVMYMRLAWIVGRPVAKKRDTGYAEGVSGGFEKGFCCL